MTKRIEVTLSCFAPTIIMEVHVPEGREAEEYIDELLGSILADEFKCNAEWFYA